MVCTTTLMQGVNLPAQNVIIRNPNLAIRKKNGENHKPKLTDYEMANLRGRAGRLLKDYIGRTFVLEEDSFITEDDSHDLFPETEKNLKSGYGDKYNQFKDEITYGIKNNEQISFANKEYSFLITYIRQIIIKHKENAINRLKSVGIELDKKDFIIMKKSLSSLSIPFDICYKNRYWDPIDLNNLYKVIGNFTIPTSPSDNKIASLIEKLLNKMKKDYPIYYSRFCKLNNEKLVKPVSIITENWVKEKKLKEILNNPYIDNTDKIEDQISIIQNVISYGLPMLLKPIYDIKNPENMFLRFIEMGAYMPITRKMIELNIPRETAIYLNEKYFKNIDNHDILLESKILEILNNVKSELNYWYKVQIEPLI